MKNALKIASLLCLLSMAHSASAHPTSIGYLYDSNGGIVHSGFGDCVRTAEWTPDNALAECDAGLVKKEAAAPARAVVAAPAVKAAAAVAAPIKIELNPDESFDSGKAELKPAAKAKLGKLVKDLQALTYDKIVITGHADRTGAKKANQQLSERRANAVHNYLVSEGVTTGMMTSGGKGSSQPRTKAGDCAKLKGKKLQACLAPDRRVEILVTGTRPK